MIECLTTEDLNLFVVISELSWSFLSDSVLKLTNSEGATFFWTQVNPDVWCTAIGEKAYESN